MKYLPEMNSIRTHTIPQWYNDCKFGIFIHWGIYSVPAWAYPSGQLGTIPFNERWFAYNPYAEWYCNTVRAGFGPAYEHHVKTYGADFDYESFADMWKAEKWEPGQWADLFKKSGAQYVIPTSKHHDGFCLWNTKYSDYNSYLRGPKRDIIKELGEAIRAAGMRYGVYYSGILNWHITRNAMMSDYEVHHPNNITNAYADLAYNQMMEIVDNFQPSILWNDLDWPLKGLDDLPYLFAHYYNSVPEGVVNDRWHDVWHDYTTKEYHRGDKSLNQKWECCRGMGLSFGYNQVETEQEHYLTPNDLIALLIDTVAFNGNLLINIGPKADGTIPPEQENRLLHLGKWLEANGEAIYSTRPFSTQKIKAENGTAIYFTQNDSAVYVIIVRPAPGDSSLSLPQAILPYGKYHVLGDHTLRLNAGHNETIIELTGLPSDSTPITIKFFKD